MQGGLARLNAAFGPFEHAFLTVEATEEVEHSVIYVGRRSGTVSSRSGGALGLAEQVDVGNSEREDEGFVFSEAIPCHGCSVSQAIKALTEVIASELFIYWVMVMPLVVPWMLSRGLT